MGSKKYQGVEKNNKEKEFEVIITERELGGEVLHLKTHNVKEKGKRTVG